MAGDPAGEHWRGERARRGRGPIALLAGLALCAATLLVYLPTPGDYWIRYDNELWLRAPRVEALTLTGAERVEALVEMFTTPHGDLYQPLMTFSIALDYKLFGENRAGYHAHAIALHLAIVLGVFALALRLSGALLASFLATLLIALHPILVETASWVIHRTILTAMGWIVVASHAYLSYARDPRRWPWLGVATAAFALSLLGKSVPSVALLPFAIDLWLGRHVSVRVVAEKLPLIAAVLLVTGLNLHFSQAIVDAEVVARPFAAVVAEAPAALVLSAANLVWPSDLAIFYAAGQSWSLIGTRWIAVALAAVAVALGGAALWRRGVRGPLLCAALWIAFLAPYLLAGAYRDTSTADRYAYMGTLLLVPGVAAALAQLAGASAAIRSSARAWGVGLVVLALALPLGVQARALARRWSDEVLLWQVVIARSPHPTAFGAMGNAYRARLDWPAAVDAYERALALLPNEPIASLRGVYHLTAARYALAAYDVSKRRGEASAGDPEHYLDVALRAARDGAARWPQRAEFQFELGRALLARGDYSEAADALARTVALEPNHDRAWVRLGLARRGQGDAPGTETALREALRIQPRYPLALEILANLYWEQGRHAEAADAFLAWADLRPSQQSAHRGFFASVAALEEAGAAQDAARRLDRYVERFPDSAHARAELEHGGAGAAPGREAPPPSQPAPAAEPAQGEVGDSSGSM
jgi:tetratricopeptide (TPR) repeat protein